MMNYLQKSIFISFILSLSVTFVNADEIGMNVVFHILPVENINYILMMVHIKLNHLEFLIKFIFS